MNEQMFIKNINLKKNNIVARFDFNISKTDNSRIYEALPTIKYILSQNPNRLVLTTHYGRPVPGYDNSKYSVQFMANILEQSLNNKVTFLLDPCDITDSDTGIFLLENVRFNDCETNCDVNGKYANSYFNMGNVFILDAFGCIHRDHMSICGISKRSDLINKKIGYGLLIAKELNNMKDIISTTSTKKVLYIMGGAKTDKLKLIDKFCQNENTTIFVGGYLATLYNKTNSHVIIRSDGITKTGKLINTTLIDDNVLDIGPQSIKILKKEIDDADIIFWNGPLGIIEDPLYIKGTLCILNYLVETNKKIIIGGGETGSVANNMNIQSDNIFISTGGGALMQYLQKGLTLCGLVQFSID